MIDLESKKLLRSGDGATSPVTITSFGGHRIGVTLSMEPEAFELLMGLAETTGQEVEDVIIKSFFLYRAALDASREGKAVGIASSADVLETEFVGI